MNLENIWRLVYRNLRVNTDPASLVVLLGLPTMYLVFFGLGYQSLIPSNHTHGYLYFLAPGIMATQTIMAGSLSGGILWLDKRLHMLAQLLMGPFTRLEYLLGIIFATVIYALAGSFIMLAVAYLMMGGVTLGLWGLGSIVCATLLGSLIFGSIMLVISVFVRSNNTYNSIQIFVIFVLNFASTVFYPYSPDLPFALRVVFLANPLTYVANVVRDGFNSIVNVADVYSLLGMLVLSVVLLYTAARAYMKSNISFT
ncbi:MAG: ABC transporter permease [Thermoprotei archaeon]